METRVYRDSGKGLWLVSFYNVIVEKDKKFGDCSYVRRDFHLM